MIEMCAYARSSLAPAFRLQELHDADESPRMVLAKLNGNAARDKLHQAALKKLGWRMIVIWECEAECDKCARILNKQLPRCALSTRANALLASATAIRHKQNRTIT
jgi:G:T-mismatch repair DNA endonuclease (very short patch repair protein)